MPKVHSVAARHIKLERFRTDPMHQHARMLDHRVGNRLNRKDARMHIDRNTFRKDVARLQSRDPVSYTHLTLPTTQP